MAIELPKPTSSALVTAKSRDEQLQRLEDAFHYLRTLDMKFQNTKYDDIWHVFDAIHHISEHEQPNKGRKLNCWWTIVAAALTWEPEAGSLRIQVKEIVQQKPRAGLLVGQLFGSVLGCKRIAKILALDLESWFSSFVERQMHYERENQNHPRDESDTSITEQEEKLEEEFHPNLVEYLEKLFPHNLESLRPGDVVVIEHVAAHKSVPKHLIRPIHAFYVSKPSPLLPDTMIWDMSTESS